ncbi:hypothetical protein [Luteolibacter sp. Populi]|uniref:hypothetical protein n=1 Tax=Luteolibacter sp. Populi TaxID=3230487 RepID=UPI0034652898
MLSRLLTPLALLSSLCLAAGDGIPASGGLWLQYKPANEPSSQSGVPTLVGRANEIQTTSNYRMKVNHATGVVDAAPRAAFDPATDFIVGDGASPVFWTRSWEDPGGVISIRDWSTGAITGTTTAPEGVALSKTYLDDQGAVIFGGRKLATSGLNGENPKVVSMQTSGSNFWATIAAGSNWIAVSYENETTYNPRIEVYNRNTLAYLAGISPSGRAMAAHGNLLAFLSSPNNITIRQLPGLAPLANIPLQQGGGLIDMAMVEGGLWVFQRASNLFGSEFRYYDLGNPASPVASNRLTPPAWTSHVGWPYQPMLAGSGFLAFAADDKSLWAWRRGESGPIAKIVPAASAREGSPASFKVKLSQAAPAAVQVQVTAQSATAMQGQDFGTFSTTVNIPAGAIESAAQEITILQDTVLEANESFILASGTTSGCIVEETAVPVIIAANGFNVEVQRQYDTNRTFRLQTVWGTDGPYLIGSGNDNPHTGGPNRTVVMNSATGAIVGQHTGDGLSYSSDTRSVKDSILFTYSLDTGTALQIPGLQVIGSRIPSGGKVVGPLDAQHMLVTRSDPNRVMVLKHSDGSVVATHTLGINAPSVTIARSIEGVTGPAVVVQDSAFTPEDGAMDVLKILNPATLEVIRSFSWPSFHPQMGTSSQLVAAGGRHAVFVGYNGVSVVDTVTGAWRWTVPTFSTGGISRDACVHGDLLLMRGLSLTQASGETLRYRFLDLKSGAIVEDLSFEDLSGKPLFAAPSILQETPTGFFVANNRQGVNIITNPVRPNVQLLADPFEDNRSGELRVVAKENFDGSHPLLIGEYNEVLEDPSSPLFGTLPQQIDLTAAGTTLPLDCKRPVATSEIPLLRAMSVGLPGAAAGFGRTTVTTHVDPVPEQPFFTGGPVRTTYAVPAAVGNNVLALGYPGESQYLANPSGAVDLYDKNTGAFLRTILPPAGGKSMRFGAALAITGSRLVIGAPGSSDPAIPGRVFVYETGTGALVRELKLKKTVAFGSSIAANGSWIAIGAPGTPGVLPPTGQNERGKLIPGTVAVFDAKTFKLRYKASTKGEMLGWSVALDGNTLFAGAPLASLKLPVSAPFAGIVRSYSLPVGKKKGKPLPILGSIRPVASGHFGEKVAVSSTVLAVYSSPAADGKRGVQVHLRENLSQTAVLGVPGTDAGRGVLHVTGDLIFSGGVTDPLRIFDLDDARPEVSYSIPLVQGLATDANYFYWGDTAPHRAALPASSVSSSAARFLAGAVPADDGDLNRDGRKDEIDLLLQHRLAKGMPVTIEALTQAAGEGSARRFRFALDADIPEGMAVGFEYSADLASWSSLLTWDPAAARWLDAAGHAIGGTAGAEEEAWYYEWQAPAGNAYFRTRVEIPD